MGGDGEDLQGEKKGRAICRSGGKGLRKGGESRRRKKESVAPSGEGHFWRGKTSSPFVGWSHHSFTKARRIFKSSKTVKEGRVDQTLQREETPAPTEKASSNLSPP